MTDPTITIAGLRAQIDSLYEMLKTANDGRAEKSSAAAWDYAARMRVESERDALAAQLAEVRAQFDAAPKACAIHSYEHGPGPCMTCGAWPPGTRELIAACRTRIAGLEQAANERTKTQADVEQLKADLFRSQRDEREIREAMASVANRLKCGHSAEAVVAEVARLTAERTEWIAAAVAIGEHVDHLGPVASGGGDIAPREWIHYAQDLAGRVKARIAGDGRPCNGSCDIALASRQVGPDGIVPRNARECAELWEREAARLWREETRLAARVAELEARPVLTREALQLAITSKRTTREGPQIGTDATIFAQLTEGGPVTLPAQDAATALAKALMAACGFDAPELMKDEEVMAMRIYQALASLGASPTSPTVAPQPAEVFAGVSIDELCSVYSAAYGERPGHRDDRRPDAIRAVLARLEVSLVAPVDPEAVARDYANNAATGYAPGIDHPPYWFEYTDEQRTKRTAAMRATLTARGIPVAPEVRK